MVEVVEVVAVVLLEVAVVAHEIPMRSMELSVE